VSVILKDLVVRNDGVTVGARFFNRLSGGTLRSGEPEELYEIGECANLRKDPKRQVVCHCARGLFSSVCD